MEDKIERMKNMYYTALLRSLYAIARKVTCRTSKNPPNIDQKEKDSFTVEF